jgi:hypothetical protein
MGGIFDARMELIGPAEAEIQWSEVDLCSHGVGDGNGFKCTDSYVGSARYKKL